MATPFVQGRLRNAAVEVTISTTCAHCHEPLHIVLDSQMRSRVKEAAAAPLVFEPHVDWRTFREPNIIYGY